MKVFEVITQITNDKTNEVVEQRKFVTSNGNTLKSISDYYTQYCIDYEMDLKSVREILTIAHNIGDVNE